MSKSIDEELRLGHLDDRTLRPMHIFILFASALGLAIDFAEVAIGGILSALFSAPPNKVDPKTLSVLLAAVYIGAVVGASLSGWLADRYGRRTVMIAAGIIIMLTAVAAAIAPDVAMLTVVRALSGLALGAYPPLVATYLTDVLPAARRGTLIMMTAAIGTLGPPALIMLVRYLTPLEPLGIQSWRWAFWVCAAGAVISTAMVWLIPESPRWLARQGRTEDAKRALAAFSGRSTLAPPPTPDRLHEIDIAADTWEARSFAVRIGFLILVYFLTPWSTIGFPLLSGAVLVNKGINVNDSLLYVAVANLGPTAGTLLAALFIDRLERRTALVVCAAAMIIVGFAFSSTATPIGLMASGLIFNMMSAILLAVLVIYAAELFRTEERARATSWPWASRGFGAILVPIALLPLLQSHGPIVMFAVVGVSLLALIVMLLAFGAQGAAGRSVR